MKKPVLFFDVIGTVVDWRSAIARVGDSIAPGVDWGEAAKVWMHEELAIQRRVESGEFGWLNRDELQRASLDAALSKLGVDLCETDRNHLNAAWEQCLPWPDAVRGMAALRESHTLVALSNSTINALTNLSKHGGLEWDVILSGELFRAYKPDLKVYTEACRVMGVAPSEATMVAAHEYDLLAAMMCGLKAAFVSRPTGDKMPDDPPFTVATDFGDLASKISQGAAQ